MSQEIFSTDFADESSLSTLEWTRKPLKVEFGSQDGKGIKVFMVNIFCTAVLICSIQPFQGYYTGNGLFTLVQGMRPRAMGPNVFYRNVHIGLRQGKEPETIVSYCVDQVRCTCPGPVLVQCEQAIIAYNEFSYNE